MPYALIGIGSNLGDRAAHLDHARCALAVIPQTTLLAFSDVYETEPVGPAGQSPYLNAAASLDTELDPEALLAHLRAIEHSAGRVRHERWGPRTLDLDLLLYDDRILHTDDLTVPHPRMTERWFVLKPLADIAPDTLHPIANKSIAQLLADLEQ
jgi:2-amino-4-hydroxy-6-hydroxymethyldihydropteridine diphosphokinase